MNYAGIQPQAQSARSEGGMTKFWGEAKIFDSRSKLVTDSESLPRLIVAVDSSSRKMWLVSTGTG